ncbi:MAG: FAD-dependent oxidoreductase [Candidatus Aminicenantes bacterium]|nr:FAD-dependent oxidoreductase [Candidatus Aminicenantes bacterium]
MTRNHDEKSSGNHEPVHAHTHESKSGSASEEVMLEQAQAELRKVFAGMPHEVPVYLFAGLDKAEVFSKAAREVLGALRQFSSKISLDEQYLYGKLAKKWEVTHSPTLLFDPDRYHVRWQGAPLGEEGRTLVEALIMMGYRKTKLSQQSSKILSGIQSRRDIKLFVSITCPYCPQQAVNALKAAIEMPEWISLEIIDVQANPEMAEKYSAHGVPMTFANEKLIAQGAQTEELFMLSLEKLEQQSFIIPESDAKEIEADLVIVGGGPAGLTAGIYAARSGLQAVVVERNVLGGQMALTPVVENYPGLTQVGGKTLVDIMVQHALEYVKIFPGEEVLDIQHGELFTVQTTRRRFKSKAILLATGATHKRLGVPGESRLSGRGVSYCSTCDGPLFKGKKVIQVGGGNSAVTELLHLHSIGVEATLVHRRDTLRAQEYLTKSVAANNIPILFDTVVNEIKGDKKVEGVILFNKKSKETTSLSVDGVFIAIGYEPAVELTGKTGVSLTPEGYIQHDARHRTNVPGIYSAGDVEGGYKQIVTAAGQGAEAAMAIFEDLINPYWKR